MFINKPIKKNLSTLVNDLKLIYYKWKLMFVHNVILSKLIESVYSPLFKPIIVLIQIVNI